MSLLKEINKASDKVVTEKYEDYDIQELFQEVMAQYKNLEVYRPTGVEEIRKTGGAIVGSAQDLIEAVKQLHQRLS